MPLAMLERLTPAQFAVALTLNVLTKREGQAPQPSQVGMTWLGDLIGSWAGMQRSNGPMRRDVLNRHVSNLESQGWLKKVQVIGTGRRAELHWSWPTAGPKDVHQVADSLRGYGRFARVPKAVAWDFTLTGSEKKVYSALHWRLFRDHAPHWSSTICVTHGQLGEVAGLHRNSVGSVLGALHDHGLVTLLPTPLKAPSRIALVPVTARYVWLDAPVETRRRRRLWMPMESLGDDWCEEHQARVECWREYGEDLAEDPRYWCVPDVDGRSDLDAVRRLDTPF